MGPLLWKRPAPEDAGTVQFVPDYHVREVNELDGATGAPAHEGSDSERGDEKDSKIYETQQEATVNPSNLAAEVERHPIEGPWIHPKNLFIIARYHVYPRIHKVLTHGTSVDIHELQRAGEGVKGSARVAAAHARAKQYPNDTEHLYSFLQVFTACVASFAHGANDVSNAIGPFSVIYHVWSSGELSGSRTPVPVWALAFGAGMLVLGLATYGYNIMAVLGNRITLHSPSRGFSMELAASITVILASQYGIPVSTTMCIVGSTIGVSLCNGDWRATNWRAIGWIFLGWILTVPIVATASGCLMGIILNAPHF
jgi:sodium-dependent phosphate transporter